VARKAVPSPPRVAVEPKICSRKRKMFLRGVQSLLLPGVVNSKFGGEKRLCSNLTPYPGGGQNSSFGVLSLGGV